MPPPPLCALYTAMRKDRTAAAMQNLLSFQRIQFQKSAARSADPGKRPRLKNNSNGPRSIPAARPLGASMNYKKIYFRVTGTPDQGAPVHLGYTDDPRRNAAYYCAGGWQPWQLTYTAMEKANEKNKIAKPEDPRNIKKRLAYLRRELRAERISYGELAELQSLAAFIAPGDVELLEAAGVPEFPEEN